ncbi:major facilitator transporter [Corynebacterium suranareeae]|uniref:Major facilitator transporter n=1 Tax=Corynebacterium suranareeae TaxID=2506452 RepID=A0A160PR04_9CORY|nr:MFS transporter [Corynebacterium suranareeae]BAU96587.1 major facilitator transporter [Corynebacterium suranareeae]
MTEKTQLDTSPRADAKQQPTAQIPLLLTTVFLAYLGQMTLNPIIAPLAREVGLAEWQIGITISTAAIMVVLSSQFWGRRSQSWGRKPVLIAALGLATFAMFGFSAIAGLGMQSLIPAGVLFALFILLRGVGFGSAIAAIPPTAQAYIADVTEDEAARTKGMAGVGAVQGVSMIGGALVGGLLAGFGLIWSILAVPLMLTVALVLVIFRLQREPKHQLIPEPVKVKVSDPRVWPFLLAGFGMFTALGFMQVLIGFIIQDRFFLTAEITGVVTGGSLLAAGIGMVVAQAVIVPRSGWSPGTLLRVGTITAVVGFLLLIPNFGMGILILAIFLIGLGLGIAMPGYTAGPTLFMHRDEQGSLAGLIGATNGLTFIIAPTASTLLYGTWQPLPIVVGTAIMALVALFVMIHPRFHKAMQQ